MADHNVIQHDDFYLSNGMSGLLLGYGNYQEVNHAYSKVSENKLKKLSSIVPIPDDFQWSSRFKSVEKYFTEQGTLPALTTLDSAEKSILNWVGAQRYHLKKGTLSDRRVELLDSIMPAWREDSLEIAWLRQFQLTKEFVEANGTLPAQKGNSDTDQIGVWVSDQKHRFSKGLLNERRVALLDSEIPLWREKKEDRWGKNLMEVSTFIEANGRFPTTVSDDNQERRYGVWLSVSRTSAAKGTLSAARTSALDAAIPLWNVGKKEIWHQNLDKAVAYVDAHGHIPAQRDAGEAGVIGSWVMAQKRLSNLGKMSLERVTALDERLPLWRDSHEAKWDRTLCALTEFVAANRDYPSSRSSDPATAALGVWTTIQRVGLRDGRLSSVRLSKLDAALPFWEDLWRYKLEQVAEHVHQTGKFPSSKSESKQEEVLGQWVGRQRAKITSGETTAQRQSDLDSLLPGWRSGRTENWQSSFAELCNFTRRNGALPSSSSKACPEEKRLNMWLTNQFHALKRGSMHEDRVAFMDANLPGWRMTPDEKWAEKLANVVSYVADNGKFPSTTDKDPDTRHLGVWLSTYRSLQKTGRLSPDRKNLLDSKLHGWDGDKNKWENDLRSVTSYFDTHGVYPSSASSDPHVAFMGGWLTDARKSLKRGKMRAERKAALDAAMPNWNDLWATTLASVSGFIDEYGRLPDSKSESKTEQSLRRWIERQKRDSVAGTLSNDHDSALREAATSWESAYNSVPKDWINSSV